MYENQIRVYKKEIDRLSTELKDEHYKNKKLELENNLIIAVIGKLK